MSRPENNSTYTEALVCLLFAMPVRDRTVLSSPDRRCDKQSVLRTQTQFSATLSLWAVYRRVGWTLLQFWLADAMRASCSCPGPYDDREVRTT